MQRKLAKRLQSLVQIRNQEKPIGKRSVVLNRHVTRHEAEVVNPLLLGRRSDKGPCLLSGNDGFGIFKDSIGETYPLKQTLSGCPKAVQHGPIGEDVFCSDERDDLHGELIKKNTVVLAVPSFNHSCSRYMSVQRKAFGNKALLSLPKTRHVKQGF